MSSDEVKDDAESGPLLERHLTIKGNELDSRDIFVSVREIIVRHGADKYRLRLTAQNKLILTK